VKFSRAVSAGSSYAAQGVIAGKDARAMAEEILAIDDSQYRDAFHEVGQANRIGQAREQVVLAERIVEEVSGRRPARSHRRRGSVAHAWTRGR